MGTPPARDVGTALPQRLFELFFDDDLRGLDFRELLLRGGLLEDLRDDDFFGEDFLDADFLDDFFDEDFFDDFLLPDFCAFVRPSDDLSLFTVAAAIRLAVFVERPRFFALSLMCSYCLSSLLLQAFGMLPPSAEAVCKLRAHS